MSELLPDGRRYPVEDRELPEWLQREEDELTERDNAAARETLALWRAAFDAALLVAFLGLILWAAA